MWPVVNPPDAAPAPAPMKAPAFALAKDRDMWPGRCPATTEAHWRGYAHAVVTETVRCKRDAIPAHIWHWYLEPEAIGIDPVRHIEWSDT